MTVEVIPNVLMKDLGIRPLFRVINDDDKFESTIVDRVRCRNDALINQAHYIREKLKEDPDAEFWDFLSYVSYKTQVKLFTSTVMVSTKGRIAYQLNDGVHISTGTLSGKYLQAHIEVGFDGKSYVNIYIHRAVACTFLPKPEKYKDIDYSKLEANHLDGVKTNPHFLNLEWGTKSDNLKHAVKTGLIKSGKDSERTKPMVGKVIQDIDIKGQEFIVNGRKEIIDACLDPMTIYSAVKGKTAVGYGCEWRYATDADKDIPHGFPERLLYLAKYDKVILNKDLRPLLGEILEGENKGLKFVLMGGLEVKSLGFQQAHISRVCNGILKTHGGCSWKYITLKESWDYQRSLTPDQLESIK